MPATESTIGATDRLAEWTPEAAPQIQATSSKPLKSLLVAFAATVTIGLGLAVWYLTNRIVTAGDGTNAPSTRAVVTHIGEARAAVLPSPPTAEEQSIADAYWRTVPPPAPLYLQIASLGPREDADFVKSLHARGFQAEIRSASSGESSLVVGPFFSASELDRAKAKLEASGVLAVEVTHVLDR